LQQEKLSSHLIYSQVRPNKVQHQNYSPVSLNVFCEKIEDGWIFNNIDCRQVCYMWTHEKK